MGLISDYFVKTKELADKYGERTLVLMQNGVFYEIYGLKKGNEIVGSNMVDVCSYCDLNIANKGMTIDDYDVVQAGFGIQEHVKDKYLKKIVDYGYTVSVWEQDEKAAGTTRTETGIYSSGTYFSTITTETSNNLLCVWLERYKSNVIIGTSNINIYTGKSTVYEYISEYNERPNTYSNDLERLVSIYNPSEIIIIHNLNDNDIENIIQFMSPNTESIRVINKNIDNKDSQQVKNCEKQTYQNEILQSIFYKGVRENVVEFMSQEISTSSYCYLLNFIKQYNPSLIEKLSLPTFETNMSKLILGNHSLKQLNILDSGNGTGKHTSVSNILNCCLTALGKRKFQHLIVNPITNINELNKQYDILEYFLQNENSSSFFRENLQYIKDLGKLNRKMVIKKIMPYDFYIIHENLQKILLLNEYIYDDDVFKAYFCNEDIERKCRSICDKICKCLDLEVCKKDPDDENYINRGIDIHHDNCVENMLDSYDKLVCISEFLDTKLSKFEKNKSCVKIEFKKKEGYSLIMTKRRATILKTELEKMKEKKINLTYFSNYTQECRTLTLDCSEIKFNSVKNDSIVVSNYINELCMFVNTSKHAMLRSLERVYLEFVNDICDVSFDLDDICEFIANCDVLYSKGHIANKYNYVKPIIKDDNNNSFIDVKGLRHPLIENILKDELYVCNDINLGDTNNGILLYGTNAVGKSSFIKSIGICIIIAQCGMFVPCSSLIYKPYSSIFTRILGNDNLFKGQSSFIVEMVELQTILNYCDENSLILGDELCKGTENSSATGIFISGIDEMYRKESSFIFATHFHEIANYDEITSKSKLNIKHLSVIYDENKDILIYDRILKDGPGSSMYGLEVCKSLHFSKDFLRNAYNIRNKYYEDTTSNILDLKQSHYNSKKIMGMCEICNKEKSIEVHHLQYQKNADDNGYIGSFHKNHVANLLSVCEACHNKLHSESNNGHKRIKTSDGQMIENL